MSAGFMEGSTARKVLEEAYKRLLPAVAYMVSPTAGFAASVAVFTTWLIKHSQSRYKSFSMAEDEKVVARLLQDIKEQEARIRLLEKARESGVAGASPRVLDDVIATEKEVLENMITELELRQLRLEALRRLKALGDERITEAVGKLIRKIESGKGFEEEELRVLKDLEERWKRKELEIAVLREVLKRAV